VVGIAWQGNPVVKDDRQRSIPLSYFERLAEVPGVQLVSLQKGAGTEQLAKQRRVRIVECGVEENCGTSLRTPLLDEASGPFMDTAALMKSLDLVISCDTAIPHLAGAVAVPVWVAVALVPDWRWLLEREDTPWYPTMRLFRQKRYGDWEDVFRRIALELRRVVLNRERW
jgi:hypothetical protein